jgi:AcrR family transcriptional regulator
VARHRTREEILDAALALITQEGAAALNLSQVARTVGLAQPSLYRYFPSRAAVYDALFQRGMTAHRDVVREARHDAGPGLAGLRAIAAASVRFIVDNPALSMMLFFPAVPGFRPSGEAYRPSLEVQEIVTSTVREAVARGEVHPSAADERRLSMFVAIGAGTASLQMGNEPDADFDSGRFVALLEPALDMYIQYYAPDR